MTGTLHGPALADRARLALAVPLARALDVALLDEDAPAAGVVVEVAGLADNGFGSAHAAAVGVLGELAAYLALAPHLMEAEHAVTHSVTTHLVDAARSGERVEARGRVLRRSGRLAFVEVDCAVAGRPVGHLSLVKSIVPFG